MGEHRFTPTHEVPPGGLATWSRPDAGVAPSHRLESELPVQLLEESHGWGRVRCHNSWEAWVDAAALVPIGAPPFRPTFAVPPEGLDANESPDPSGATVIHLDADLPVEVVGVHGDRLRLRAANGWEGWVAAGTLVPLG